METLESKRYSRVTRKNETFDSCGRWAAAWRAPAASASRAEVATHCAAVAFDTARVGVSRARSALALRASRQARSALKASSSSAESGCLAYAFYFFFFSSLYDRKNKGGVSHARALEMGFRAFSKNTQKRGRGGPSPPLGR